MAKVSSRYDSRFVEYLKSIGGRWDPQSKTWTVPESRVAEVLAKAKELYVQVFKIQVRLLLEEYGVKVRGCIGILIESAREK